MLKNIIFSSFPGQPSMISELEQMLTPRPPAPGALFGRPWASFDRLRAPSQFGNGTRKAVRAALDPILANSGSVLVTPKVTF